MGLILFSGTKLRQAILFQERFQIASSEKILSKMNFKLFAIVFVVAMIFITRTESSRSEIVKQKDIRLFRQQRGLGCANEGELCKTRDAQMPRPCCRQRDHCSRIKTASPTACDSWVGHLDMPAVSQDLEATRSDLRHGSRR